MNPQLFAKFHEEINRDLSPHIPDWEPGPPWQRSLRFRTPMQINSKVLERFLGSTIGGNGIEVIDFQKIRLPGDGTVIIDSVPAPQLPGTGDILSSTVTTRIGKHEDKDCCRIEARVSVSASVPSFFTSTVENAMLKAAEESLMKFLNYTVDYIQEITKNMQRFEESIEIARSLAEKANIPSIISAEPEPLLEAEERFYNTVDFPTLEYAMGMPSEANMEAIFMAICYSARTGDQILELIGSLQKQVDQLEAKLDTLSENQIQSQKSSSLYFMSASNFRKGIMGIAVLASGALIARHFWKRKTITAY